MDQVTQILFRSIKKELKETIEEMQKLKEKQDILTNEIIEIKELIKTIQPKQGE